MRWVATALVGLFAGGLIAFNLFTFLFAFARRPPRRVVRAFLTELLAGIALLPWWPLWAVIGASYEAAEEGEPGAARRPIILLHGYAMNRTNWLWLGHLLRRRGLGPLYGLNYFSFASVAASAARLSRFIEAVRRRTGAARVDIVAHSLGGIVARRYVEQLGGADHVGRLVTIGTPHHGTKLAGFGLGAVAREMAAGSPFLDELGRSGPPAGVHYTSVWSRCDNLVVPPESARLGDEDVVFDDLGHLSLLVSPRVADVVAKKLGSVLA